MAIWIAIRPGRTGTRVLATAGAQETLLKANLASEPAHPRAVPALLEAVALWQGEQVRAALCVGGRDDGCGTRLSRTLVDVIDPTPLSAATMSGSASMTTNNGRSALACSGRRSRGGPWVVSASEARTSSTSSCGYLDRTAQHELAPQAIATIMAVCAVRTAGVTLRNRILALEVSAVHERCHEEFDAALLLCVNSLCIGSVESSLLTVRHESPRCRWAPTRGAVGLLFVGDDVPAIDEPLRDMSVPC
jgi:hypothetical protein